MLRGDVRPVKAISLEFRSYEGLVRLRQYKMRFYHTKSVFVLYLPACAAVAQRTAIARHVRDLPPYPIRIVRCRVVRDQVLQHAHILEHKRVIAADIHKERCNSPTLAREERHTLGWVVAHGIHGIGVERFEPIRCN
jgi:hypothetical protein